MFSYDSIQDELRMYLSSLRSHKQTTQQHVTTGALALLVCSVFQRSVPET